MKKAYFLFSLFIISLSPIFAQNVHIKETHELRDLLLGNESHQYKASQYINCFPEGEDEFGEPHDGFVYTPQSGQSFVAEIDPYMIILPEEGDEIGGPPGGDEDDEGVVGSLDGSFNVNSNGAASYSVPIELPVGIAGLMPEISLNYNSGQMIDGEVGPGWSIGGISAITMVNQNYYYDGRTQALDFDNANDDAYVLDGQRLIRKKYLDTYEYRTENWNFSKITHDFENNTFVIKTKDGLTKTYGAGEAKLFLKDTDSQPVMMFLKEVKDVDGNFITFEYTRSSKYNANMGIYGKSIVISKIKYSGHKMNNATDQEHLCEVNFNYEEKVTNLNESYWGGLYLYQDKRTIITHKRLTSIVSSVKDDDDNEHIFREYSLEYINDISNTFNKNDNIKFLNKIFVKAGSSSVPPLTFDWDFYSMNSTRNNNLPESIFDEANSQGFIDINKDGKTDLFTVNNSKLQFYISDGSNYIENDDVITVPGKCVSLVDYNGDGEQEFVFIKKIEGTNGGEAYLTLWKLNISISGDLITYDPSALISGNSMSYSGSNSYRILAGDYDGDGKTDVIVSVNNETNFLIYGKSNLSEMVWDDNGFGNDEDFLSLYSSIIINYDGSSASNLMRINQNEGVAKVFTLQNNKIVELYDLGSNLFTTFSNDNVSFIPANLNNDNKTDLIRLRYNWGANMQDIDDDYIMLDFYLGSYDKYGTGGYVKIPVAERIDDVEYKKLFFGDSNGDGVTNVILVEKETFTMPYEEEYDWTVETRSHVYEYKINAVLSNLESHKIYQQDGTISQIIFPNIKEYDGSMLYKLSETYWRGWENPSPGLLDWKTDSKIELYSCFRKNKKQNDNVITEITNSLASKIKIRYGNLLYSNYYTNDKFIYPNLQVDFNAPLNIVEKVTYDNGFDLLTLSDYYYYKNAVAHNGVKGFLGFEETTVVSTASGTKATSYYDFQQVIFKDHIYEQILYSPELCSTVVWNKYTMNKIREEKYNWKYFHGAAPGDIGDFVFNNKQIYFQFIEKTVSTEFEKGVSYKVSSIETTMDHYGNPNRNITKAGKTEANLPFVVENHNVYKNVLVNENGNSVWQLGRLKEASVKNTLEDGSFQEKTSKFKYYSNGILHIEIMEPDHDLEVQKEYIYDKYGNITFSHTSTKDWNGLPTTRTIETVYDESGRFVEEVNQIIEGKLYSEKSLYNKVNGLLEESIDINGLKTIYIYDDFGMLEKAIDPLSVETQSIVRWVNEDDQMAPEGSLYFIWAKSSAGLPKISYFDKLGRKIRTVSYSAKGRAIFSDLTYDLYGRLSRKYEPYFANSTASLYTEEKYDYLNRIINVIEPNGSLTEIQYLGLTKKIIDPELNVISKTHNEMGQLIKSEDMVSSVLKQYSYIEYQGEKRREEKVIDEKANEIIVTFDLIGNKRSLDDPDLGKIEYTYDGFGNLILKIDNALNEFSYEYDEAHRLTSRYNSANDEFVSFSYDNIDKNPNSLGLLDKVLCQTINDEIIQSEEYNYDSFGRILEKNTTIEGREYSAMNTYDTYGRVKEYVYPSGFAIRNIYNANGALEMIKDKESHDVLWALNDINPKGQILSFTYGNGIENTMTYYDETGYVEDIKATGIQNMHYDWDVLGNLESRTDRTNNELTESFTYDKINRLLTYGLNTNKSSVVTMQYDDIGNIIYKSDIVEEEPANNITNKYKYSPMLRPHAVIGIPNILCSPERISQEIEYNSFNKVSRIEQNGKELFLTYGINRQRVKQEIKENDILLSAKYYISGNYEEIIDNEGLKKVHYIKSPSGLTAIYTKKGSSNELNYVHQDHLGSIQYLSNENGELAESFSYDPWGKRRDPNTWLAYSEIPEGNATDRGFTGHEHLDLFELVNMNGRIYDPVIARFISPDPIIQSPDNSQSLNRYSYAMNNPLVMIDPSGYSNQFVAMATIVGILVSVAVVAIIAGPGGLAAVAAWGGAASAAGTVFIAGMAGALVTSVLASMWTGTPLNQAIPQAFIGTIIGGLSAGVSFGIGGIAISANRFIAQAGRIAMHGVYNGVMSIAQGGKFIHGFISAAMGSISGALGKGGNMGVTTIFAGVLGGTASVLTGGKFANGAMTAAFVALFNELMHQGPKLVGKKLVVVGRRIIKKVTTINAMVGPQRDMTYTDTEILVINENYLYVPEDWVITNVETNLNSIEQTALGTIQTTESFQTIYHGPDIDIEFNKSFYNEFRTQELLNDNNALLNKVQYFTRILSLQPPLGLQPEKYNVQYINTYPE